MKNTNAKNGKPPKKVKVGIHEYKVVVNKSAIDACSVAGGNDARLGECNQEQLVITIEPNQAPTMLQETLLHEILHACCNFIGASEDIDDKTEEKIVLRLSPVLMGVLRANPALVNFLLHET